MKGHWHRECPNASDGRGSTSSGSMAPPSVGFTYAGFGRESFSTFLSEGDREVLQMIKDSLKIEPGKDERACLDVFLSLRTMSPGLALADIGAGEDLIGLRAFQELSQALGEKGWTAPQLSITPKPASGVGGDAKALYYVILPIQLGGTLGFARTKVLDNNIPHLLSVGLLDHVGAIIDLPNNSIKYQNSNHVDKMHKLDSGHRAVQVVPSSPFTKEAVSPQMCTDFGLSPEDFSSRGAYKERLSRVFIESQPYDFVSHTGAVDHLSRSCQELEVTPCESRSIHSVTSPPQSAGLGSIDPHSRNSVSGISFQSTSRHGEGTSSSVEAHVPSDPVRRHSLHAANGSSTHESKGYEEFISSATLSRVDRRTEGMSSSSVSSSTRRESVGKVGTLSEMPGQTVLHSDQEPKAQGKVISEVQGSINSGSDHGANPCQLSSSNESSRANGQDRGDCGCCVGQSCAIAAHSAQSHASTDSAIWKPPPTVATGSISTMASPGIFGGRSSQDGVLSDGLGRLESSASNVSFASPTMALWSECLGSSAQSSDDAFLVFLIPSTFQSFQLFPGETDISKRQYLCKTSQGFVPCDEFSGATHVKCYSPVVASMCMDQDLADEDLHFVKGKERKALQEAVKQALVGLGVDPTCAVPATKKSVTPWESSHVDLMEVFNPGRFTEECHRQGLRLGQQPSFDFQLGWNVFKEDHLDHFWKILCRDDPYMVILSPECRAFSLLVQTNWARMDPKVVLAIQEAGLDMWFFAIQVARHQIKRGHKFLLEHPQGASSWKLNTTELLIQEPDVECCDVDMCAFGLSVHPSGLSKKPTRLCSNDLVVLEGLSTYKCTRNHTHVQLQGGLPHKAAVYPPAFCDTVVRLIRKSIEVGQVAAKKSYQKGRIAFASFPVQPSAEEDEEGGLPDDDEDQGQDISHAELGKITEQEKNLVRKVHVNMSHPSRDQFLRVLKAAGAKARVLHYVKEHFQCDHCDLQRFPKSRRKAAIPPTYAFNRVVGVDLFYINFERKVVPFLNVVDHGTGFQMCAMIRDQQNEVPNGNPGSHNVWRCFQNTWLRYLFEPEIVITDDGPEFSDRFVRGLEQHGTFHHIVDRQSPWQNARAERHGGWVKEKLQAEISAGTCILQNEADLEEFVSGLTTCKNHWYNRGGFSPLQLMFGENPRMPHELLSDDPMGACGLSDLHVDAAISDSAAGEFSRRFMVRFKARERAMERHSKDRINRAANAERHEIKHWNAGQWVYVWRIAAPRNSISSPTLLPRNRWVGPGIVLLQSGKTVYVSMRSRLWKCSSDQLRPALRTEVLGAALSHDAGLEDLLTQVTSNRRAAAVNVEIEGPPSKEAWHQPPLDPIPEPVPSHEESPQVPNIVLPPGISISSSSPEIIPEQAPPSTPALDATIQTRTRVPDDTVVSTDHDVASVRENTRPLDSEVAESSHETKRPRLNEPSESNPATPMPTRLPEPHEIPTTSESRVRRQAREVERRLDLRAVNRGFRSGLREARSSGLRPYFVKEPTDSGFNYFVIAGEESDDEEFSGVAANGKTNEISLKDQDPAGKKAFEESDLKEWEAIHSSGAVRVLSSEESDRIRRLVPDRIMSSRMVRRWKPMPGVNQHKAKSRWCVHGHQDVDAPHLQTFAPTPMTESLYLFLVLALSLDLSIQFADVKNAFCQSDKLQRDHGPLYAEVCSGLPYEPKILIELLVPVYGLLDAPRAWRNTVVQHLEKEGFRKSILEQCWYVKRNPISRKIEAMMLLEVDDFVIASTEQYKSHLEESLKHRFVFGKWAVGEEDYAGRHIKVLSDRIEVTQEKYILENLQPIYLGKGRKRAKAAPLLDHEFEQARSLLYKISWVAKETRPEASGLVSIIASRLAHGTVEDVLLMNKMVTHLRSTAQRPLILWKMNVDTLSFVVVSDAGGVGSLPCDASGDDLPSDGTQGAWLVLACEQLPHGTERVRVSPICWRSSKLKRRVPSTLAGEALAMSQGVCQVEWLQVMFRDILHGDVTSDWEKCLNPFVVALHDGCQLKGRAPQAHVVDAKSVFDVVQKGGSTSKEDRRTSIELSIVVEALAKAQARVRWIPHFKNCVDALTKVDLSKCTGALLYLLKTGTFRLVDEASELERRATDVSRKDRSRNASERSLEAEDNFSLLVQFCQSNFESVSNRIEQFQFLGPPSLWTSEFNF